jgi:hypothetical protein
LSTSPTSLLSPRPGDSSHFPSRSPSSQPFFGRVDIVPHGKLYGALFLALVMSD